MRRLGPRKGALEHARAPGSPLMSYAVFTPFPLQDPGAFAGELDSMFRSMDREYLRRESQAVMRDIIEKMRQHQVRGCSWVQPQEADGREQARQEREESRVILRVLGMNAVLVVDIAGGGGMWFGDQPCGETVKHHCVAFGKVPKGGKDPKGHPLSPAGPASDYAEDLTCLLADVRPCAACPAAGDAALLREHRGGYVAGAGGLEQQAGPGRAHPGDHAGDAGHRLGRPHEPHRGPHHEQRPDHGAGGGLRGRRERSGGGMA